ncbi:HAD-IIA family hydrolase [Paenibacillus sp. JCM 10914]|uniref:HAD-IIA family hydrolase n=1 Tax=Paenibacillus sp. JCM 10914 TaxID=1236974 RepID=UPI0003CC6725|nr:HAD-IIA family hydrolase [Paenibacillus sp. JCM 10914]GAE07879.1 phosphoglycolate phosphatase [Paenibacillus sp. JCM 10914]
MDHFSGYIFDLDGTIYLGSEAIEGAVETVHYLQSLGKKLLFLTNKTIDSRENYLKKLAKLGIQVELTNILNPALVTIHYLQQHHPGAKVYVIGEDILKNELLANGIDFAQSPEETDMVVVSWDREFHYRHLNFAYQAIKRGAKVIATHPDRTCPMPGGDIPDCGGMIGAIEGTAGIKITTIMGKPSVLTALTAIDILGVKAEDCLMSGDRLETDIRMGNEAGMSTALVLTGVSVPEDLNTSTVKPTYVINSVHDIYLNSTLKQT